MHRPRNRQPRDSTSQRGRSRGRGRFQNNRSTGSSSVPNVRQVVQGGFVSIVLKADQDTGYEVRGVVQDVLTSGNHPRGIKVRLVDGRVGRVQRMVSEGEATTGSEDLSGVGETGEVIGWAGDGGSRYQRNVTGETNAEVGPGYSLGDFLPPGHPLRNDGTASGETEELNETQQPKEDKGMVVCPVCGVFEGDEAAVSHHVNGHFDGS